MANEERWLSVEEIAVHMGVSKETVYRWLERGKIPAHRIGKLWKFKASEVDEWVKQGGATEPAAEKRDGHSKDD
jgi:excisionase family DNA binding protein